MLVPVATGELSPPALHELIGQCVKPLAGLTRESQRQMIVSTWARLNVEQRFIFHKLLSGEFRVGVSRQLLVRALALVAGIEPAVMAHRLAGNWQPDATLMPRLLGAPDASPIDPGMPYPFMLANPLGDGLGALGDINDWLIEWKWDGIRATDPARRKIHALVARR